VTEREGSDDVSKQVKFGIGIAIILLVVGWEAVSGFQESKTYYVTVSELVGGKVSHQHIRVGGIVEQGSIARRGGTVTFRLAQDKDVVPVNYVGSDTLPDTFRDGAQAIVEGTYKTGGQFQAEHIQAKCASKYEAAPGGSATQKSST
jgi:cytochrome c-type biogenesis protein CcmE